MGVCWAWSHARCRSRPRLRTRRATALAARWLPLPPTSSESAVSTTAHRVVYQSKKPTRNNRIAFARVMVTADMSSLSFSYELTGIYLCSHFLYSLFRDPRWGRGQETAGECPFLSSEYVTAFITSFQGGGGGTFQGAVNASSHEAAPAYMMAAAVVKHAGEQLHRISLLFSMRSEPQLRISSRTLQCLAFCNFQRLSPCIILRFCDALLLLTATPVSSLAATQCICTAAPFAF